MTNDKSRLDLSSLVKRLALDWGVIAAVLGVVLIADNVFEMIFARANRAGLVRHYELLAKVDNITLQVALAFTAVFMILEVVHLVTRLFKRLREVIRDEASHERDVE